MQNEHEQKLNAESDLQEKSSVYDFLYHDVNRINSFLSQFDPNGYLYSSTKLFSQAQDISISESKKLTAKLPAIVEGNSEKTSRNSDLNKNEATRTYIPLWQNSLAFLDYLNDHQLINTDISHACIGQFVLVTGELFLLDIGFLKKLTREKTIKHSIIKGIMSHSSKTEAEMIMEVLNILPDSIQARLRGQNFSTWSTLKSEGINISTDDLLLKHGSLLEGRWYILGILDAYHDRQNSKETSFLPSLQNGLTEFSKLIRPEFGRPNDYFGITPLLIFREVSVTT